MLSASDLNSERALLFRLVHIENLETILRSGLVARSQARPQGYVEIGNPNVIRTRAGWQIRMSPFGTISDYVSFYFTPWSIMQYNIITGYSGVVRRTPDELAFLISSVSEMQKAGRQIIISPFQANCRFAEYFSSPDEGLSRVDWALLQKRDFQFDQDDPAKHLRYQAECLVHQFVPLTAILGIAVHSESARRHVQGLTAAESCPLTVAVRSHFYFSSP